MASGIELPPFEQLDWPTVRVPDQDHWTPLEADSTKTQQSLLAHLEPHLDALSKEIGSASKKFLSHLEAVAREELGKDDRTSPDAKRQRM